MNERRDRVGRFVELLDRDPLADAVSDGPRSVIEDFAEALSRKGVEARVEPSERRYRLVLSPQYRPGYRNVIASIDVDCGEAQAMATLEMLARDPIVRGTIDELRVTARQPVAGRLERENGMATLVVVPPETQRELATSPKPSVLNLAFVDGEPVRARGAWVALNSAGLRFDIEAVDVHKWARRVRFRTVGPATFVPRGARR